MKQVIYFSVHPVCLRDDVSEPMAPG